MTLHHAASCQALRRAELSYIGAAITASPTAVDSFRVGSAIGILCQPAPPKSRNYESGQLFLGLADVDLSFVAVPFEEMK